MKTKAIVKMVLDAAMTLALLVLMGYQFFGQAAHEWVGAGMFALFFAHNLLNFGWYRNLFKGRYTPMRVLTVSVNLLVLAAMLTQMYSGIVMSRHVFAFLPIDGGMMLARRLHILGAYWGYALLSLHLGLHWGMFLGMAKKRFGQAKPSKAASSSLFFAGLVIAVYGLYALFQRDLPSYMLLQNEFVFMDFEEPKLLFYLDYLSIMGLFVFLGHVLSKACKKLANHPKEVPHEKSCRNSDLPEHADLSYRVRKSDV
ncbi:DUF4405 domain-containing protein [uncultured Anaerotruncus sp.]|uniref:DUF4405 domain-containing protein n=1 Tax=uncultured Anaerotruncus sp. TaxID=905011 RepID=UPI00280B7006|nr:DUF4405 domain-containing protein [uncultured Anaerotruncus sp.]